jgi:SAM-dependent methyltransferase
MHEFDKAYWEDHWAPAIAGGTDRGLPVNPYLPAETRDLPAGTALDAGCGTGAEALWLADHGWRVTGADISTAALAAAADRAAEAGRAGRVEWVDADLTTWEPGRTWDLVITSYAHPHTGQMAFYERIASWVSPSGTLLIVGHLHGPHGGSGHPDTATATQAGITGLFDNPGWQVDASYVATRTVQAGGQAVHLYDVVVRAHRCP